MPAKKEPIEAQIRKLSKSEGNKFCVDCNEKMPGYANMTHNTFVCMRCSGLHREFQFKIKGISMSTFTVDDLQALQVSSLHVLIINRPYCINEMEVMTTNLILLSVFKIIDRIINFSSS